jgi:hypothetical protein
MFRTLIYPSLGACDCVVELPHRSSCSQFVVYWRFGAAGFEWCSFCRLKHKVGLCTSCASACKTNTTQNQPPQISNTQRTESKTTDVVIQQHSRTLLMMDTLMSEICWAHKKWNKITSDIKLVFHSSTRTHNVAIIFGIIIVEIEINRGNVTSISFEERGGYLDFGAIFKKKLNIILTEKDKIAK